MLPGIVISITVNLPDRLWRQSNKVTGHQKLKIIKFAEEHENCPAQREFGIAESNICLWCKCKQSLEKMWKLQSAN